MLGLDIDAINGHNRYHPIPFLLSMDLQQLRHFLAVSETLHFGNAAERLGMAQPHLSRAIAGLETEIGVRLFVRTSRKVQLTPAGEVLRGEAEDLLRGAQRAAAATKQAALAEAAALRIAFVSAALYGLLPLLIRRLRESRPGLEIELQEASTEQQMELLSCGAIDLGLGHVPVTAKLPQMTSELLLKDRFDALVPADHPFASKPNVTFNQLAQQPFVLFPESQGPALFAIIRDQCRLAGGSLKVVQTATRLHSQCALVAAGLGVGLVPMQSRSLSVAGTVRCPIKPYPETLTLSLAVFRDARRNSPAIHDCVALLRSLAQVMHCEFGFTGSDDGRSCLSD